MNLTYRFADRVRAIVSHYEFLTTAFSEAQFNRIQFEGGLIVAKFSGKTGAGYQVRLGTYSVAHNEGEMLLSIETSDGVATCFAIFTVGASIDGEPRIEVGCIQGARAHVDSSITQRATKDFHSMRPKHLLMGILYGFAEHFGIHNVVCVSTRCQVNYRDGANAAFHAQYDPFWEELGGRFDSSGFYVLPARFSHRHGPRNPNQHPSRHRRRAELRMAIHEMLQNTLGGAVKTDSVLESRAPHRAVDSVAAAENADVSGGSDGRHHPGANQKPGLAANR